MDLAHPQLRQWLAAISTTGPMLSRPFGLVPLAEAAVHAGQAREGLDLWAEALAASPALKARDWEAFDAQAREATKGGGNWVAVATPDGVQHVNTHVPRGSPLPQSTNAGITWSGHADQVFRVSNLFYSRLSRTPIVAVELRLPQPDGSYLELATLHEASSFSRVWVSVEVAPIFQPIGSCGQAAMAARCTA